MCFDDSNIFDRIVIFTISIELYASIEIYSERFPIALTASTAIFENFSVSAPKIFELRVVYLEN